MPHDYKHENILKAIVGFIILIMYLFQAIAMRGLYADGSFQLLNLLLSESGKNSPNLFHELVTSNNEPLRFFTYIMTELPTVMALRLGVTSLPCLIDIFSSWLLLAPLLFWGLGLWRLRNDFLFWPFVLLFTVIYFNGNFFIIGEYNLAYALSACCLAYLLKADTNAPIEKAALLVISIFSIMSYGSTLLTGLLFCALSIRRFLQTSDIKTKTYWSLLITAYAASFAAGVWGYLHPQLPENLKNARNPQILLHDAQFLFTLFYAGIALSQLWITGTWRNVQAYSLPAACFLFLLIPLNAPPFMSYQVRAYTGLALFFFMLALSIFELYRQHLSFNSETLKTTPHLTAPILALFLVFAISDIQNSWGFRNYVIDFKHVVNNRSGLIPFERSIMFVKNADLYGWTWTYPTMGLLLREHIDAAVIMDPAFQAGHWRPFDPTSPPDLSRYY